MEDEERVDATEIGEWYTREQLLEVKMVSAGSLKDDWGDDILVEGRQQARQWLQLEDEVQGERRQEQEMSVEEGGEREWVGSVEWIRVLDATAGLGLGRYGGKLQGWDELLAIAERMGARGQGCR